MRSVDAGRQIKTAEGPSPGVARRRRLEPDGVAVVAPAAPPIPSAFILEILPMGIAVLDAAGLITYANPAMADLLGTDQAGLPGRSLADWVRPAWAHGRAQWRVGQGPGDLRRSDGQRWAVRLTVAGWGGAPPGRVVVLEDVRQAKQLRESLHRRETLAQVGRVATSVLHEVGNPLQAIQACLDLHLEAAEDGRSSLDHLWIAREELERLRRLLARFRDLYHPEPEPAEEVEVNAVVDEVARLSEPLCAEDGIRLETHLEEGLPPVRLPRGELKQIVLNLVLNAEQAMPDGGVLALSTSRTAGALRVEVEDSGVGIQPELLSSLADGADAPGLGLYLVRSLAERHGGRLEVESAPGSGSRFSLILPSPDGRAEAAE